MAAPVVVVDRVIVAALVSRNVPVRVIDPVSRPATDHDHGIVPAHERGQDHGRDRGHDHRHERRVGLPYCAATGAATGSGGASGTGCIAGSNHWSTRFR